MDDFTKYENMRENGATPQEIYRATKEDELNPIEQLKVIRRVFNLSFEEAKEVSTIVDSGAHSLSDFQATFKSAIEELENNEKGAKDH